MSEIACRYAQALWGLTQEEKALEKTAPLMRGEPDLWDALCGPSVRPEEKAAVVGRLPFLQGEPVLRSFYQLLARKGRMALLPEIVRTYEDLALRERGGCRCLLRCAKIPSAQTQEALKNALCKLHHKQEILLEVEENPSLLGGFTLELEGVTYDQSLKGRLSRLARYLQMR